MEWQEFNDWLIKLTDEQLSKVALDSFKEIHRRESSRLDLEIEELTEQIKNLRGRLE